MDPAIPCCPNLACPASGQIGQGTIGIHACQEPRVMGTACPQTCSDTQDTALDRLRASAETVSLVVTRIATC